MARKISTDIPGGCSEAVRMPLEVNEHCRPTHRPVGIGNYSADMHGYLQIYSRTIGMGFSDEKDASRTIRTGFMDRIVVSHDTRELTEKSFLIHGSLYKGYLAWLFLIYTFCNSMCIHQFLEAYSLYSLLYMFEDIFCWHTDLVKIVEVLVF